MIACDIICRHAWIFGVLGAHTLVFIPGDDLQIGFSGDDIQLHHAGHHEDVQPVRDVLFSDALRANG